LYVWLYMFIVILFVRRKEVIVWDVKGVLVNSYIEN